jgi:ribosomal protein S27AE
MSLKAATAIADAPNVAIDLGTKAPIPAIVLDGTPATAPCPKCATTMVLAAITPHPLAPRMQRHTFLCGKCNQTKTYMLQAK